MKKIIIFSMTIILLSSCSFWVKNDDINKAKQELLNNNSLHKVDTSTWLFQKDENTPSLTKDEALTWKTTEIKKQEDQQTEDKVYYKVENLTPEQFIEIDDLSDRLKNVSSWIEITWKTLTNVDKIIVSFENKTSDFPIDNYRLGQFKAWDKTFVYRAKWEFKVLDFWNNEYIFEAYSWDKISKLKVLIHIPKEIKETSHNADRWFKSTNLDWKISYEKKIIWNWDDSVYLSFPKSDVFGDPLSVWTDLITYSNIDNLKIKRVDFGTWIVSCENMTDFLKNNVWSWFYWNTCRDIIKDKWISVYVIRLDWDKYIYEKKYFDFNHGLIWNYIVKDNIKADKENIATEIAELNSSLKETNKDSNIAYENYPELKVVDKLFYEIVR
jgi:hypothetical protein